jgi:hypothetical protein
MGKVIELSLKESGLDTGPDGGMYLTAQIYGVRIGDRLKIDNKVFEVKYVEYYFDPSDMFMAEVIGVAS